MPAQSIWTLLSWGPDGWSDDIASGVLVTIALALATLPIGLVIGFFVAFAKQHGKLQGNNLAIIPLIEAFHKKEVLPMTAKASDFLQDA